MEIKKFDNKLIGHRELRKVVMEVKKLPKDEAEQWITKFIHSINKTNI